MRSAPGRVEGPRGARGAFTFTVDGAPTVARRTLLCLGMIDAMIDLRGWSPSVTVQRQAPGLGQPPGADPPAGGVPGRPAHRRGPVRGAAADLGRQVVEAARAQALALNQAGRVGGDPARLRPTAGAASPTTKTFVDNLR